jgi:hypothetical protein
MDFGALPGKYVYLPYLSYFSTSPRALTSASLKCVTTSFDHTCWIPLPQWSAVLSLQQRIIKQFAPQKVSRSVESPQQSYTDTLRLETDSSLPQYKISILPALTPFNFSPLHQQKHSSSPNFRKWLRRTKITTWSESRLPPIQVRTCDKNAGSK